MGKIIGQRVKARVGDDRPNYTTDTHVQRAYLNPMQVP